MHCRCVYACMRDVHVHVDVYLSLHHMDGLYTTQIDNNHDRECIGLINKYYTLNSCIFITIYGLRDKLSFIPGNPPTPIGVSSPVRSTMTVRAHRTSSDGNVVTVRLQTQGHDDRHGLPSSWNPPTPIGVSSDIISMSR
jgi:hypothetical protein